MKDYSKNPLSIDDQIKLLESRGLLIPDRERVRHYLSYISYYRLRAYTYPYQDNEQPDHPFHTGITFDRILEDYLFDRHLRIFIFLKTRGMYNRVRLLLPHLRCKAIDLISATVTMDINAMFSLLKG